MEEILNYDTYINGMNKSAKDKLFFLDKIDGIKTVVDFGCADGNLAKCIIEENENLTVYGYDINDEMLKIAKSNNKDNHTIFSSDFATICHHIEPEETVLNMSSVLHEVYSYSKPDEINKFWENVFERDFKYISLRDFCIGRSANRDSDINDYTKILSKGDSQQIQEYEDIWGSLKSNRNLIHYLMKYRYKENWNREVRENYFPLSLEGLLSKIPTDKYRIVYFENYILPYTSKKVKEDFGIEIRDNTHIKLLLEKVA